jgi:hypothetical protein
MYESENEPATRRAKCLAYGLLVVAAMTFTFELGRQRGVADAGQDALDHPPTQVAATMQLVDELNRLRASAGRGESQL